LKTFIIFFYLQKLFPFTKNIIHPRKGFKNLQSSVKRKTLKRIKP
jgi:hypothetical protein